MSLENWMCAPEYGYCSCQPNKWYLVMCCYKQCMLENGGSLMENRLQLTVHSSNSSKYSWRETLTYPAAAGFRPQSTPNDMSKSISQPICKHLTARETYWVCRAGVRTAAAVWHQFIEQNMRRQVQGAAHPGTFNAFRSNLSPVWWVFDLYGRGQRSLILLTDVNASRIDVA